MLGNIFNVVVNIGIVLAGILQFMGMMFGIHYGVCLLFAIKNHSQCPWFNLCAPNKQEDRCASCSEHDTCEAADTGVAYPCSWYKKKEEGKH